MTGFCRPSELSKVNFALSKLCSAYASQRISEKLYRRQRALLFAYAFDTDERFPDLVLNEYSQAAEISFEPEVTPVVDDLGFAEDNAWQDVPAVAVVPAPEAYAFDEDEGEQQEGEQEFHYLDSYDSGPHVPSFDRFYWVYLVVFLAAIGIFVATQS